MADITVDDKNTEVKPPGRGGPPVVPQEDPTRDETVEEHVRMRMQPSPAPFSRYQRSVGHENEDLTTADIKPPVSSVPRRTVQGSGEELEAGCCKCVIM